MAVILLLGMVSIQTSHAQSNQSIPNLFPHNSKPFNVTMEKWLERYWIWVASMPKDIHPRGDTTGKNCGTNQNGPVWFLDPPVEQPMLKSFYCEIPEGKAIFVPLLVGECDPTILEDPTDSNISVCAKEGGDQGNIKFRLTERHFLKSRKPAKAKNNIRYTEQLPIFSTFPLLTIIFMMPPLALIGPRLTGIVRLFNGWLWES